MEESGEFKSQFGYVSASKLIIHSLLLASAVFSALSISYIAYLRSNIPPLVLARAMHLILVPALLMIGLDITSHQRYMLGATLISISAVIVDLVLHVLNFIFGHVFLNRIASLSALISSATPIAILIAAITLISTTESPKAAGDRAAVWVILLSQLSIIVAAVGIAFAILNVFSPHWALIWFLSLPNWVIAEGFGLSHRRSAGAAFSAASSGFNIVATIVALFAFQSPPIDFITLLFVSVLDIPIGAGIAVFLMLIKAALVFSIFILYGGQFAISAATAFNLSRKNFDALLPIHNWKKIHTL